MTKPHLIVFFGDDDAKDPVPWQPACSPRWQTVRKPGPPTPPPPTATPAEEWRDLRPAHLGQDAYQPKTRKQRRAVSGWRRRRLDVLRAAGWACVYCGAPATTVDHVVPLSRGGGNGRENLAAACLDCNLSKSSMLVEEWRK